MHSPRPCYLTFGKYIHNYVRVFANTSVTRRPKLATPLTRLNVDWMHELVPREFAYILDARTPKQQTEI